MSYLKQTILLYKQDGDTFSSTSTAISDAYDIQLETGKSDKKDFFTFKLINPNNKYFNGERKLEIGDNVKIYFWKDASTYTDSDLQFDGIITEPPMNIDSKGRILTVKGYGRTDMLFTTLVFISKQAQTIPQIIKYIIDECNDTNFLGSGSPKKIRYVYDGLDQDGNVASPDTISLVDSNGDTITSTFDFRETYKRASMLLKKYSSSEYTGDGTYLYRLDESNYFHWGPSSRTIISDTVVEGVDATDLKIKINKDNLITTLIINVGMSPSRKGNTVPVVNPEGITKHGNKAVFISTLQDLTEGIMREEEANNSASFEDADHFPSSYDYTTFFKSSQTYSANALLNLPAATKDQQIVVSNDKQYDAVIRKEAEFWGKQYGKYLLEQNANPRFVVEATMKQRTNTFTPLDFISHTIEDYNFDQKNLRLMFVKHTIWETELESEEDAIDSGGD